MIKKIILGSAGLILLIIIGFLVFIFSSYEKDYSDQYPVPDLSIEITPERVDRGRYLAQGPAHCFDCHSPKDALSAEQHKDDRTLSGGFGLDIAPGTFYAPNITPDPETGIGKYSDGQIYRMLRHNIRHDGQTTIDFMPFINMSDEDIYSIIAYLRSQKTTKNRMPERSLSFLGKMLFATGAIKPGEPQRDVKTSVQADTSIEYGQYMAHAVANCFGCHTERDPKSGEFVGEPYAGGMQFGPDRLTRGWVYISPNLTPDEDTGIIADWDEESFIVRMRVGKLYDTTPMPWDDYKVMTENDLKAVYSYLKTLKPVSKSIDETAVEPN